MNPILLRNEIIEPALNYLREYNLKIGSPNDKNLVFGTICAESDCAKYVRQMGYDLDSKEGAFGICQMEKNTHDDIWRHFINYRVVLKRLMDYVRDDGIKGYRQLVVDPLYAVMMCRIHYLRAPEAIPQADDIEGLAHYWKTYYNTEEGKGTERDFIEKYKKYNGRIK